MECRCRMVNTPASYFYTTECRGRMVNIPASYFYTTECRGQMVNTPASYFYTTECRGPMVNTPASYFYTTECRGPMVNTPASYFYATECRGPMVNTPASYFRRPGFKSLSPDWGSLGFPQSLQANTGIIVTLNWIITASFRIISNPVRIIILSSDAILFELLTASLNRPQIKDENRSQITSFRQRNN
jgi:hypothetical protein